MNRKKELRGVKVLEKKMTAYEVADYLVKHPRYELANELLLKEASHAYPLWSNDLQNVWIDGKLHSNNPLVKQRVMVTKKTSYLLDAVDSFSEWYAEKFL